MINFNDIQTAQSRYQEWVHEAEKGNYAQTVKTESVAKTAVSRLSQQLVNLGGRLHGRALEPARHYS